MDTRHPQYEQEYLEAERYFRRLGQCAHDEGFVVDVLGAGKYDTFNQSHVCKGSARERGEGVLIYVHVADSCQEPLFVYFCAGSSVALFNRLLV